MLKSKKNKGITLISLVVTIVVLLILAGVTIGVLIGDNGLLNQATKAKKETEEAAKKEDENLKELDNLITQYTSNEKTGNLYEDATDIIEDQYYMIYETKLWKQKLDGYRGFILKVDSNTDYICTFGRFIILLDNEKQPLNENIDFENVTTFNTREAKYIAVSYNKNTYTQYSISKLNYGYQDGDSTTGELTGNNQLTLENCKTSLRKGEIIKFSGKLDENFESVTIGFRYSTDESGIGNKFVIDKTKISLTDTKQVEHGLNIQNDIDVEFVYLSDGKMKVTLNSNSKSFVWSIDFVKYPIGYPFATASGSMKDCKLSWNCTDLNKEIWIFGDSYLAYSPARWTYYLHQDGYDNNVLLDGFPGESGVNGRVSFANLLKFGKPKIAIWCHGMNDGTDSDGNPNSNWVKDRDVFLSLCQSNNIEPIFATIPTVPNINHEVKNKWIRESGYRYIDFANAVGANEAGTWYENMLSSDKVHPSEDGAKALYQKILTDLPEIKN